MNQGQKKSVTRFKSARTGAGKKSIAINEIEYYDETKYDDIGMITDFDKQIHKLLPATRRHGGLQQLLLCSVECTCTDESPTSDEYADEEILSHTTQFMISYPSICSRLAAVNMKYHTVQEHLSTALKLCRLSMTKLHPVICELGLNGFLGDKYPDGLDPIFGLYDLEVNVDLIHPTIDVHIKGVDNDDTSIRFKIIPAYGQYDIFHVPSRELIPNVYEALTTKKYAGDIILFSGDLLTEFVEYCNAVQDPESQDPDRQCIDLIANETARMIFIKHMS